MPLHVIIANTPYREIEEKIFAARTRLILDKPFLGALILRLPLQAADPGWCPTTGTDARKFYYNPAYIYSLKPLELQFVLAHEALHCALSHFARRQHRIKHRWDLACDYAINPVLLDEGFSPPPGVTVMSHYRDMTAEEIYPLLQDKEPAETMDQHLYDKPGQKNAGENKQRNNPPDKKPLNPDKKPEHKQPQPKSGGESGDNKKRESREESHVRNTSDERGQDINPEKPGSLKTPPPPLSEKEQAELAEKWQHRLAGATQQATQAGKMSKAMQRLVALKLKPRLPWRVLLARYFSATARDDYAWSRPSTRRGGTAIFPGLKSAQPDVVLAVDVSGSITDAELNEALSEVNALKGQVRARITLIPCDNSISKGFPRVFEAWEGLQTEKQIVGGGGTDFCPVFDWLGAQDMAPDLLVYFTDGMGRFPQSAPPFPVIWLIKGKKQPPWGERIQLN